MSTKNGGAPTAPKKSAPRKRKKAGAKQDGSIDHGSAKDEGEASEEGVETPKKKAKMKLAPEPEADETS